MFLLYACAHVHIYAHTYRLESIAADAELQEKSLSEMETLADTLQGACQEAELEHQDRSVYIGAVKFHTSYKIWE